MIALCPNPNAGALLGYVPAARAQRASVVETVRLARDTFRVRFACPEMAAAAVPGQFFMVRPAGGTDPLLGRPLALYDTWLGNDGRPAGIDIVYLVVGKMTGVMSGWRAGDEAELWGPLGNGFPAPDCDRLILVAGGIGQTPFLATIREALGGRTYGTVERPGTRPREVVLCYGARSADYLAGLADFEAAGARVRISTDDGSAGLHGRVTELLRQELADNGAGRTHVYACGPEPMLHAVQRTLAGSKTPAWISLETPMACGFGACFSCVAKIRQADGGWDYRRICVEGPIFPARDIVFDESPR